MDITLLSTADYSNPFWTNKQHQANDFADLGHRVLYIDSLGLRRPSASARDMGRIFRRIGKALRGAVMVRPNLYVLSPLVLPMQRYGLVRALNRVFLQVQVSFTEKRLGMRRDVLWTYNPLTLSLLPADGYETVVYNCVDDISAQPGMPAEAIRAGEEILCRYADAVFATAPSLAERCSAINPNTHMVGNVCDFAHFSRALAPETPVAADICSLPAGPRIGFVGALSGYKVDFALIRIIALAEPSWQMVLVGEIGEGDPWTDPSLLHGVPNIHIVGPRAYQDLPSLLKAFDVAILPSPINDYTRGMYPMKLNEYLAAGKPVVSTPLPALQEARDVVWIADGPAAFMLAIRKALAGEGASLESRLSHACGRTYRARTERMMQVLAAHSR